MKNDWFETGEGTIKIRLRRGGRGGSDAVWVEIDKIDFPKVDAFPGTWIAKWNPTAETFYARRNGYQGDKGVYMHRLLKGITDRSVWVDHDDHNGLNNKRRNMKRSNVKLNGFNRKRARLCSTSQRRNVYWNNRMQKWMVWFTYNGKRHYFGYFTDEVEAERVAIRERARVAR